MDDPLLVVASLFPLALLAAAGYCIWQVDQVVRTPADLEADVLAALSHAEALPLLAICGRPPLVGARIDPEVVRFALEHLRRSGRAVRWYTPEREAVYRRVSITVARSRSA